MKYSPLPLLVLSTFVMSCAAPDASFGGPSAPSAAAATSIPAGSFSAGDWRISGGSNADLTLDIDSPEDDGSKAISAGGGLNFTVGKLFSNQLELGLGSEVGLGLNRSSGGYGVEFDNVQLYARYYAVKQVLSSTPWVEFNWNCLDVFHVNSQEFALHGVDLDFDISLGLTHFFTESAAIEVAVPLINLELTEGDIGVLTAPGGDNFGGVMATFGISVYF